MRPLLFSIFLLLCHPAWSANCAEVAATLNRDLNPKVDAVELAEVLASLNRKGQLPAKFISKREARAAGWTPGSNLWQALPGRSIGGDRFGNYEKTCRRAATAKPISTTRAANGAPSASYSATRDALSRSNTTALSARRRHAADPHRIH